MTGEGSQRVIDFWSDARVVTAMVGVVGLIISSLIAFATASIVGRITKQANDKQLFQTVMQHMTGRTQNRSVGIALLKNYGDETGSTDVVATIFLAQMLHLHDIGYGREEGINLKPSEEHRPRQIEKFNYEVMKGAVEGWNLPQISDKAKGVAEILGLAVTKRRNRFR